MSVDHTMPHVELFTDGACKNNPGPGGWAWVLKHPESGSEKEGFGGEHHTTNNRMEVLAVIRGLEALKGPSRVDLHSDSKYVVDAIDSYLDRWKACRWKKSLNGKTMIKNADLWRVLYDLCQTHQVAAHWVKGHAGHVENERCDKLAEAEATRLASLPAPPLPEPEEPPTLFGP